jgi:hypothetical protein
MQKTKNLKDMVFGKLTAKYITGQDKRGCYVWMCECSCGGVKEVQGSQLSKGGTRSCGCLRAEVMSKTMRTHGKTKTTEYRVWAGMMTRCFNPNTSSYHRYGGRGITVCERWRGQDGFVNFLADAGPRPSQSHTLDRINSNGNYEPGNIRWVVGPIQSRNRVSNRMVEYAGKRLPICAWAEEVGISGSCILQRLNAKWSVAEALSIPAGSSRSVWYY